MNRTDELVERLVELKDKAAQINAQIEETTAALLADHQPGTTITYQGRPVFKVTANRLFDKTLAAAVLTEAQQQQCSRFTLDPKLARETLDPDVYAKCQKLGAPHLRPVTA